MRVQSEMDVDQISAITDPHVREVMLFVKETMDRLAAMEPQACGEAILSLVATACSWCPDPVTALDDIVGRVRSRLSLLSMDPQGHG